MAFLEIEQLRRDGGKLVEVVIVDDSVTVSILRIAVRAEIHSATQLSRSLGNRKNLIEVRFLDDGVESDAVDSDRAHSRNEIEDFHRKTWNSASDVMALVEVIERDVELVDARFPERPRTLDRQHSAMCEQRAELHAHRLIDAGNNLLEIAPHCRLAAGVRDHHRIEESGSVRKTLELGFTRGFVRHPIIAERTSRVAAERNLEMNEYRFSNRREVRVLREKYRYVPGTELAGQHLPPEWNMNSVFVGGGDRSFVSRIGVSRDTDSGIIRQHALETYAHFGSSIRDNYLPRVK